MPAHGTHEAPQLEVLADDTQACPHTCELESHLQTLLMHVAPAGQSVGKRHPGSQCKVVGLQNMPAGQGPDVAQFVGSTPQTPLAQTSP